MISNKNMSPKSYIVKNIIFLIFIFSYSFCYSNNLKINGLMKLNVDDLQALTDIELNKKNYTEIEINKIVVDLYKSDLIYDIKIFEKDNLYILNINENKLIENIYIN